MAGSPRRRVPAEAGRLLKGSAPNFHCPSGACCVWGELLEGTMDAPALTNANGANEQPGSTIPATGKRFCLILIKPSHYDDDGYVIQWLPSSRPSASLPPPLS